MHLPHGDDGVETPLLLPEVLQVATDAQLGGSVQLANSQEDVLGGPSLIHVVVDDL